MSRSKELMLTGLVVFAVIILIYGIVFFNNKITGKVSLELESVYEEDQPLDGVLKISLKEGELIPVSSRIVLENAGEVYEYALNKYLSDSLSSGEFYIEGTSISGTGEGYGIEGEKIIYPTVYFTLNILTKSGLGNSGSSSVTSESTESVEADSEEIVEETETSKEGKEKKAKEDKEKSKQKEAKKKFEEETSAELEPTITGNIILDFFSRTFNFFLRITGQVSLKLENELKGEVSANEEFIYELKGGQTAEILPGSVKTDSKKLSNNEIDLDVKGNKVIITTAYSETEQGFGKNYLGNNARKTLAVDLSKLDFIPKQGDLKISLVYEDEEIISLKTSLIEGEIYATNETVEEKNETEINLTINFTNDLTEEEREILFTEFGDVSVEITKAEKTSQGIIVKFEIKEFWVEHYYDPEISDVKLKEQVKKDKTNFLKDLARKFSKQEIQKQKIEGLIGSYDI